MSMIDLKKLVEAGVHFGHHSSKWHPKMKPYIWGTRNKVHLINVAKTAFLLDRAEKFLEAAAAEGKQILWVGTKKTAQPIIRAMAEQLGMPFVYHRWIGGTLSNFDQVRKAITRLLHLRDAATKSTGRQTKKEHSVMLKEIERLEKNIGGISSMNTLPAAIVVVDAKKERAVIREANNVGIPVVCLVDTNTDPSGVSYLIPGNDDSAKSIEVIFSQLAASAQKGKAIADAAAAEAAAKAAAERAARKKAADEKKAADDKRAAEAREAAKKTKEEIAAKVDALPKHTAKAEAKPKAVEVKAEAPKGEANSEAAPTVEAPKKAKPVAKKEEAKPAAKKPAAAKAPAKKAK
ncbi:MAG: small subunit ribosomal protein [Candidatus Dependentiae bacterium]|nr:small subunit ribosomal protein [Candidatus Dependentiae bacterium]